MSMINISGSQIEAAGFCPTTVAENIYSMTHRSGGIVIGTDSEIHLLPEAKTALKERGVCHDAFAAKALRHLRDKLAA